MKCNALRFESNSPNTLSQKATYGKWDQGAVRALHSWWVTQPGGVGAIVGRALSARQQLRGWFDHSYLSDSRSLLRSTRFRSMAASGPCTAPCTLPETLRQLVLCRTEIFSFLISRRAVKIFSFLPLQNPSMFCFCVYGGCSVAL